jgi:hypothetical protein
MANPRVIVYHYSYSPYARRLIWYLALRGIPYSQCVSWSLSLYHLPWQYFLVLIVR